LIGSRRFELLGQLEHSVQKSLGLGVGAVDVPLSIKSRIAGVALYLNRL
jgi:hypothetical protein